MATESTASSLITCALNGQCLQKVQARLNLWRWSNGEPIKEGGSINTPNSVGDLHAYIERMRNVEKVMAYTIMGMTWNLASDMKLMKP